MQTLTEKLTKLKDKHKNEKSKILAKFKAEQKKQKEAEEKAFLAKILKLRKKINNDDILLGGLLRTLELVELKEEQKTNQLIELTQQQLNK